MNPDSVATRSFSPLRAKETLRLWLANAPRGSFWRFFAAWCFFTLGFSIFYFLFNIYLLGFGWTERSLGYIGSLMSVGSILGTIPAGRLIERLGLRWTLMIGLTLAVILSILRACILWQPAQLALALLGGIAMCSWAVCLPPVVAAIAKEPQRPFAFSLLFSSGIGFAGLGGLAAGRLPGWLMKSSWGNHLAGRALSALEADRASLLIGCAIVALALVPLTRIALPTATAQARQAQGFDPFLIRFLPAVAVWGLVTGAFAPFANVYFVHHLGLSLERTGVVFSLSQLAQFAAILSAPMLLRWAGLASGIMITQLATAAGFAMLSVAHSVQLASSVYCISMAAQYMNEPGIYSLLMVRTSEHQRSRASAATLFVTSASQALAALAMGSAIVRFGYSPSIACVALLAVVAAILFRRLSRGTVKDSSAVPGAPATTAV
jgi:MFS family permease